MISSFSVSPLCHSSPPFSNIQAVALVGKSEIGESLVALWALVTDDIITCVYAHVHTLACMHMSMHAHLQTASTLCVFMAVAYF